MSTVWSVCAYWCGVFAHASQKAVNVYGTNPKKVAVTAIITGVAAIVLNRVEGWETAFAKVEWWLILLIAEIGVVCTTFVLFLVATPYWIQREAEAKQEVVEINLKDKEEKVVSLEKEVVRLNAFFMAEVEKIRNEDPRKKTLRNEFKAFREDFERVSVSLKAHERQAVYSLEELDKKVGQYVNINVPGYVNYGKTDKPLHNTHMRKPRFEPHEFVNFIEICENRILTLDELIKIFS